MEALALIVFSQLLGKLDVHLGNLLTCWVLCQDLWLGLELIDRLLDSRDDRSGPGDGTRGWWHVFRDRRAIFITFKQFLHLFQLIPILLKHSTVLLVELLSYIGPCVHIVEIIEQVEGTSSRVQTSIKCVIDECDSLLFARVDASLEVGEGDVPLFSILWQEDITMKTGKFVDMIGYFLANIVNTGTASSHSGEFLAENGVELL